MPRYDLDDLTLKRSNQSAVTVGVAVVLYSEAPFEALAAAAARALETFLGFAPSGAIDTRWSQSGWVKASPRALTSTLSTLRKVPSGREAFHLFFGQGRPGAVGTHAFRFDAARGRDAGSIAFEFPLTIFDHLSVDALLGFIVQLAELVPFSAGNAGLAFRYNWTLGDGNDTRFINGKLRRYLAIDAGMDSSLSGSMAGRSPRAHWVNLVGPSLATTLGAPPNGLEVQRLAHDGLLLRSAEFPPVGDLETGAQDLAFLPATARYLQPVRIVELWGERSWLASLDTLSARPCGPWQSAARVRSDVGG